jgi:hypothetical protein
MYEVNVYDHEPTRGDLIREKNENPICCQVEVNTNLDTWDEQRSQWNLRGYQGCHLGIAKIDDIYVLIVTWDWEGETDHAYFVSDEEALQAIIINNAPEILDIYPDLKLLKEDTGN